MLQSPASSLSPKTCLHFGIQCWSEQKLSAVWLQWSPIDFWNHCRTGGMWRKGSPHLRIQTDLRLIEERVTTAGQEPSDTYADSSPLHSDISDSGFYPGAQYRIGKQRRKLWPKFPFSLCVLPQSTIPSVFLSKDHPCHVSHNAKAFFFPLHNCSINILLLSFPTHTHIHTHTPHTDIHTPTTPQVPAQSHWDFYTHTHMHTTTHTHVVTHTHMCIHTHTHTHVVTHTHTGPATWQEFQVSHNRMDVDYKPGLLVGLTRRDLLLLGPRCSFSVTGTFNRSMVSPAKILRHVWNALHHQCKHLIF